MVILESSDDDGQLLAAHGHNELSWARQHVNPEPVGPKHHGFSAASFDIRELVSSSREQQGRLENARRELVAAVSPDDP